MSTYRASLGVGHVWTAVACPAYASSDPRDCTCDPGAERPAVWILWSGGVNYSPGYVADDAEPFGDVSAAFDAVESRYCNRDGMTPCVSDDAASWLYFRDPREESDPYPDGVIELDPARGSEWEGPYFRLTPA